MKQLKNADIDEGELDRVEAIILSMTPDERANPGLINGSRRKRIADGSGTKVQHVKQLVKQFDQMRKMMRAMASGKMPDPQQLAPDDGGSAAAEGDPTDPLARPRRAVRNLPPSEWQSESDLDEWVPRRTRSGGSSSPTSAPRVTAARSRRSASYNPQTEPSTIVLDEERARHWLEHGAQPSETVATLLRTKGIAASGS